MTFGSPTKKGAEVIRIVGMALLLAVSAPYDHSRTGTLYAFPLGLWPEWTGLWPPPPLWGCLHPNGSG